MGTYCLTEPVGGLQCHSAKSRNCNQGGPWCVCIKGSPAQSPFSSWWAYQLAIIPYPISAGMPSWGAQFYCCSLAGRQHCEAGPRNFIVISFVIFTTLGLFPRQPSPNDPIECECGACAGCGCGDGEECGDAECGDGDGEECGCGDGAGCGCGGGAGCGSGACTIRHSSQST